MIKYSTYKVLRLLSIVLLFIVGINAIAAGYSLITKTDGSGMGMSLDLLKSSPFTDFFIPGLFLLLVNGGFSLYIGILITRNHLLFPRLVLLQGGILTCWIIIQMGMIQLFHPLHLVIGATGLFLIVGGYLMKSGVKPHANKHVRSKTRTSQKSGMHSRSLTN